MNDSQLIVLEDIITKHVFNKGYELTDKEWSTVKDLILYVRDLPKCPYTHAHTRHWCGYEGCREA